MLIILFHSFSVYIKTVYNNKFALTIFFILNKLFNYCRSPSFESMESTWLLLPYTNSSIWVVSL